MVRRIDRERIFFKEKKRMIRVCYDDGKCVGAKHKNKVISHDNVLAGMQTYLLWFRLDVCFMRILKWRKIYMKINEIVAC